MLYSLFLAAKFQTIRPVPLPKFCLTPDAYYIAKTTPLLTLDANYIVTNLFRFSFLYSTCEGLRFVATGIAFLWCLTPEEKLSRNQRAHMRQSQYISLLSRRFCPDADDNLFNSTLYHPMVYYFSFFPLADLS